MNGMRLQTSGSASISKHRKAVLVANLSIHGCGPVAARTTSGFISRARDPLGPQRVLPPKRLVRARLFDGLKNLLPGNNKQPQPASQEPEEVEEAEEEEDEGSEMVRLDAESGGLAEDQGVFGPLAVLLVGFQADEVEAFRSFMLEMEADMVKIVPCSPALMSGTLQTALESEFPKYEQPPLGTRRTVFLSGMVGAEVMEVIGAYKDAGMPPTVWAAAVPNNYTRIVGDLVAEVHADNAAMVRRAQEAQAREELEQQQQE